ncbi:hypothetical protein Q5P01_012227 [Channa striata]|uniref:Coiled-coil domain-containing protein n=1 Tax=Channa striata TaxID=64152 RepID=A0AA88MN29_CHASR|nr:hypothetical protein Q5P01_012227 [Channa striata]
MPGEKMPNCPSSASKGFSSTPVKISQENDFQTGGCADLLLSDDEDTFSLLSPIYHDSFDSEEEVEDSNPALAKPRENSKFSISLDSCELPKTPSDRVSSAAVHPPASPTLSAWEVWLVNKAKEDRLKFEKKAKEERLLKEKKEQQESELEQKKIVMEKKIQEWLKMKREQEKHKLFEKQSKEEEAIKKQQEKQREIEQKAQKKYKDWLQKKNREKVEKEKNEKKQAALEEEWKKERHKRAEEKFKQWLAKSNEKSRASPMSPCYPTSPYDKSYPSPSFYNPIPWKPIHVPPPETSQKDTPGKKPQKKRTSQPSPSTAFRFGNTVSAAQLLQRR